MKLIQRIKAAWRAFCDPDCVDVSLNVYGGTAIVPPGMVIATANVFGGGQLLFQADPDSPPVPCSLPA